MILFKWNCDKLNYNLSFVSCKTVFFLIVFFHPVTHLCSWAEIPFILHLFTCNMLYRILSPIYLFFIEQLFLFYDYSNITILKIQVHIINHRQYVNKKLFRQLAKHFTAWLRLVKWKITWRYNKIKVIKYGLCFLWLCTTFIYTEM